MKKKNLLVLLTTICTFYGCSNEDDTSRTYILNLPNYNTHTLDLGDTANPAESWADDWGNAYSLTLLTDNSKIFEFDCISTSWGFSSDSFAFTNCTVETCENFSAQDYRAVPKRGITNNTYVIVGSSGYKIGTNRDKEPSIRFKDDENFAKSKDYQVKGIFVTNSAIAYESMKVGSSFFSNTDKFGAQDSFKLTIYNMDKTKSVDFYLAEGSNIITDWKWVDLTSLGRTKGLKFKLETTKKNESGAMTPTYFCLDGITLIEY